MAPGLYRLTRDVENPQPDRRQRYDWRALPTWKAGTRFYVRERAPYGAGYTLQEIYTGKWRHQCLTISGPEHRDHRGCAPGALIAALEPIPPKNVHQALQAADLESYLEGAINILVAKGVLTYEQIIEAAREYENTPDE